MKGFQITETSLCLGAISYLEFPLLLAGSLRSRQRDWLFHGRGGVAGIVFADRNEQGARAAAEESKCYA